MITENEAKEKIIRSDWNVKNVKFMRGHDGDAMSCTLYKGGAPVASVFDDSYGGQFSYNPVIKHQTNYKLLKDFQEFAETMQVTSEMFEGGLTYDMDIVVSELVQVFEEQKQIKKLCRDKIVFKLKSEPDELYYVKIKGAITDSLIQQAKEQLSKRHGEDFAGVLNN